MHMNKRITGGTAAAALGILALVGTGTAFAAGSSPTPTPGVHQSSTSNHPKAAVDTPDAPESATGADTDNVNVQQGDQQSTDTGSAKEKADTGSSGEKAGSETGPSDGPGGHADGPGNVDHQFNGNE